MLRKVQGNVDYHFINGDEMSKIKINIMVK